MKTIDISSVESDFKLHIPKFTNPVSKTEKAAGKIEKKYGGIMPPEPPNIGKIFDKAYKIFNGSSDDTLTQKELKSLAFTCFDKRSDEEFIISLVEKIKISGTKRHYTALLVSYIMGFSSESSKCKLLAKILKENEEKLSKAWLKRLDFADLLDVERIENNLATKVLSSENETTIFQQAGLVGSFQSSRIATSVIMSAAEIVHKQAKKNVFGDIESFINVISENARIKPNYGAASLVGLLLPFTSVSPPSWLKNKLKELFLNSFKDPRISSHHWPEIERRFGGHEAREKCISIIKKWLNFDSIDLFFKIIAKHAPNEQFEPRKKLWQTYFDQEYVADAWVILGSAASRTANELKRTEDTSIIGLRWADLSGALNEQSVLLMQIGDLVIAEWSHSGKFRAWSETSSNKPKFYKSGYTGTELRKNSNQIRSVSGGMTDGIVHNGNWVQRAKDYINQETGIRLARK